MSILLDVRIGLEINVLTSKFILLGDQMLGEMGCHPEICFYVTERRISQFQIKLLITMFCKQKLLKMTNNHVRNHPGGHCHPLLSSMTPRRA